MESFADALDMVTVLRPEEPVYCLRPRVLKEAATQFMRSFLGGPLLPLRPVSARAA